ncbi:MAG: hypothetical protein ACRDQ5_00820 [Sciscionella sp.]
MTVLLRAAQWKLDDVAHDLPAGRTTDYQCQQLAELLIELASLLLARTDIPEVPDTVATADTASHDDSS